MSYKVRIQVTAGPMKGQSYLFEQHDIFLFGRSKRNCHAHIQGDPQVSRHHFILEVNPPMSRIRDLGSRNGTFVNDTKHGGRADALDLKLAGKATGPNVDLVDGDVIRAGKTEFQVFVEQDADDPELTCSYEGESSELSPRRSSSLDLPENGPNVTAPQGAGGMPADNRAVAGVRVTAVEPAELDNHPAGALSEDPPGEYRTDWPPPPVEGFEIREHLGSGGMGAVYLAHSKQGDQLVAIKFLRAKVNTGERARSAFLREISMMEQLEHRNIIACLESRRIGNDFCFIMEYCEGGSINQLFAKMGRVPGPKYIARILSQLLSGLAFAHERGFVHRDLKPGNILMANVGGTYVPKLADFGLAKNFEQAGFSGMTATGVYGGSFPYMAKEQLTNYKYVNPASDVFSLGASFYRLLTGHYPRDDDAGEGRDPISVILNGQITPLIERLPDYHAGLAEIIDTALIDDFKRRYANGAEMLFDLRHLMRSEGW